MQAKVTLEFTETFIEMIKQESGYSDPKEIAAFLKGLYTNEFEGMEVAELFIRNCTVEVTE